MLSSGLIKNWRIWKNPKLIHISYCLWCFAAISNKIQIISSSLSLFSMNPREFREIAWSLENDIFVIFAVKMLKRKGNEWQWPLTLQLPMHWNFSSFFWLKIILKTRKRIKSHGWDTNCINKLEKTWKSNFSFSQWTSGNRWPKLG